MDAYAVDVFLMVKLADWKECVRKEDFSPSS